MKLSKPRGRLIGMLVLGIALLFPGAALASEITEVHEAEVNGYRVSLGFFTEIKTGENSVHVQILDPHGQPAAPEGVELMLMRVEETAHTETDLHSAPAAEPADPHAGMQMNSEPATENSHAESVDPHGESALVTLQAGHESGAFEGAVHFEESGEWNVVVHFKAEGESLEVEFPVTVARAFSRLGVLASIFGLNVAVVSMAAVLKPKNTTKAMQRAA